MRGSAEIIATVLLIVITIAIGFIFYNGVISLITANRGIKVSISDISLWRSNSIALLKIKILNIGDTRISGISLKVNNITLFERYWSVTWFQVISESGKFGYKIGNDAFAKLNFNYHWGNGRIYGNYSDRIGYIAVAMIKINASHINVTIMTNDGMQIYIDGKAVFKDSYHLSNNVSIYSKALIVNEKNIYSIAIRWYDWEGLALSSINISNAEFADICINPGETVNLNIPLPGDLFSPGETYLITLTAYDDFGNTYSVMQTVECVLT